MGAAAIDDLPARVFVGTDPSQTIACKVLERSMREHSTIPIAFDRMQDLRWPFPRDPRNQPRTEFSFHRFAIPKRAGYRGRALYVDADMLVLRDLRELWTMPFEGATVLHAPSSDPRRPKQLSVMLLDCDRLRWNPDDIVPGLDAGRYGYDQLVTGLCLEPEANVRPGLAIEWNSLDRLEPGRTALVHYTHLETQPWVHARHPHGDAWVEALRAAVEAGDVVAAELEEAVARGWIRPSLPAQLRTRRARWPAFTRWVAPVLDLGFRPHRALRDRQKRVARGDAQPA
jgi:hypothetical protein